MKNQYFKYSESDGYTIAKTLEKNIRYKIRSTARYEPLFDKIIKLLKKIRKGNLKNISLFIKNFDFKPKLIGRLANKRDNVLKKLEERIGTQKPRRRPRGTIDITN